MALLKSSTTAGNPLRPPPPFTPFPHPPPSALTPVGPVPGSGPGAAAALLPGRRRFPLRPRSDPVAGGPPVQQRSAGCPSPAQSGAPCRRRASRGGSAAARAREEPQRFRVSHGSCRGDGAAGRRRAGGPARAGNGAAGRRREPPPAPAGVRGGITADGEGAPAARRDGPNMIWFSGAERVGRPSASRLRSAAVAPNGSTTLRA